MKTIEINSLSWDVENLELNGETYFTCDEAMLAAKSVGKRLPTREELDALVALGSTWDYKRLGRWFGEDSKLKEKSKKSVFFPALGCRNVVDGALYSVGYGGFYWSSSVSGASGAYFMYFYSGEVYPAVGLGYRASGQSVRCVKNINN
jgi:uncharacterized protein (TIGR02145 family)